MQGLSSNQVALLLKEHGHNELPAPLKTTLLSRFLAQLNNVLIYLLLGAVVVSFAVNDYIEGALILIIVVLNACIGIYQEGKAEEAIELLQKFAKTFVRVIRDGKEQEIDSVLLVPGDLVYVEEGAKIPADGVIFNTKFIEVNESSLTGESLSIPKQKGDGVYLGTLVAKGRGYIKIEKTGANTRFGAITTSLKEIHKVKTPLQEKLMRISRTIGIVGIVISIIVFTLSYLQGDGAYLALLLAISLAVAVVPEGLPAVMTVALSNGVKAMAKRNAIIRKLPAIEALGNITIIATDKTGTLTANKMTVKHVFTETENDKRLLLMNGVLCSTASLVKVHDHGTVDFLGDPTEGALLIYAHEQGVDIEKLRKEWQTIDEVPFDSETRQMMVKVKSKTTIHSFIKGAPEMVFAGKRSALLEKTLLDWTNQGYRVIAFSAEDKPLGMVALYDPPRKEVPDAIARARSAGIEVVMITGDNPRTAEAIGTQIGLLREGEDILTGEQLDEHSDLELLEKLNKIRIFARTNPIQKSRIVSLFQQQGEVVAVTGDGINDIVALKKANVGIAMGLVGTDVARETADIVLADDNFATIVNAVEEGRNIIKNLKGSLTYLFTGNFSEALTLVVGLIIGLPTLFFPIQLLYINLVSDGLPALALAFSPRNEKSMSEPPQREITLLGRFDMQFIVVVGIAITATVLGAYYFLNATYSTLIARTGAFVILDLSQAFIFITLWLSFKPLHKNLRFLVSGMFALGFFVPFISQLIVNQVEPLDKIFHVQKVPLELFGFFILASTTTLFILPLLRLLNHKKT